MHNIRLDNHTAAKPLKAAVGSMLPFLETKWGSLSSPYWPELQHDAAQFFAEMRQWLGASQSHYFVPASSAQDAAMQVFLAHFLDHISETGRNHFLTTEIEEAAIQLSLNKLEKAGCAVKTVPLDACGRIDPAGLKEAIRPRDSLLSFSWANSLTGVIQPIAEISQICREKEISLHVDLSHVVGKLYFHLEDLYCDYASLDGSKFHAPQGSAGYFTRKKQQLQAANVPALAALCAALKHADDQFDRMATEVARLKAKLEKGVAGSVVLFQEADRLPNVAAIAFPGAHSEALAYLLARKGVFASFGGGQSQRLSHMLKCCKVPGELADSALSFSLSLETTEDEIDTALEVIDAAVKQLRRIGASL